MARTAAAAGDITTFPERRPGIDAAVARPADREVCPALGRPCPAALRLAGRLAAAVGDARGLVGPAFGIEAAVRLGGCPAGCTARVETPGPVLRLSCASGASVERAVSPARLI